MNATVLLSVDPASYDDAQIGTRPYYQGTPHPIAWLRDSPVDLGNGTGDGVMTGRMWMTRCANSSECFAARLNLSFCSLG